MKQLTVGVGRSPEIDALRAEVAALGGQRRDEIRQIVREELDAELRRDRNQRRFRKPWTAFIDGLLSLGATILLAPAADATTPRDVLLAERAAKAKRRPSGATGGGAL